jgi:ribonucleoside-diphosphate reductase alpha chain
MKWLELNNQVNVIENGFYQLEKDKEAVHSYFVDYVNQNTVFFHDLREKIDYLLENNYYDKELFAKYKFSEIKAIFKLAYKYEFRFQSYMAAAKFYEQYALQTDDGERFLERYEDRVSVVAMYLGDGNVELAKGHVETMMEQNYQPATPTFLNAGRARGGEKISCFIMETEDSTEGIMYAINSGAQLSRRGGGVGIGLSKLRAHTDPIKGIDGCAGGVVGVAKLLEDTFIYFNQLGQRPGSCVAYLNIFHDDIDAFLDTKRINVDEAIRLSKLSIGVLIPDKFMELVISGEPYYTFSPYSVYKEYNVYLDDIDMSEWYDIFLENPKIKKYKRDARKMITKIAACQQESGYPYLIFIDNANRQNALKRIGRIKNSNLCVEIFQISHSSIVKGFGSTENVWGEDISCVLGSLNLVNIIENNSFEKTIKHAIYGLNTVVNYNVIPEVPSVTNGNESTRAVGLGLMNLHGLYAKNGILYGNPDSVELADIVGMMKKYYTLKASMEYAREYGIVFKGFKESEYYTGEVFAPYIETKYEPTFPKVIAVLNGIYIPTQEDWENLWRLVQEFGIANGYQEAIAPNASTGYLMNATPSVLPITKLIEIRTYEKLKAIYPVPYLSPETIGYYVEAYDMDQKKMIDVIAALQKHVDQGISTTLFIKSDATTKDLVQYYMYAWRKKLKSLYYTRTKKIANVEEALGCESCMV